MGLIPPNLHYYSLTTPCQTRPMVGFAKNQLPQAAPAVAITGFPGNRHARLMLTWSVLNVVDNFPVEPISAYLCASVNHPMEIHGISILKKYYGEESKYKL